MMLNFVFNMYLRPQLGVSALATAATGAAYSLYSARYFKPTNIRHHPY
jgi:hypothetical protein